jgi:hypothetical protein
MEHLAGPLIIIAILAFFALMIKWTGMGKYAEAQRMFETQKQIIDKLGSGPEMIQFIGSKEGREFFERLKAPPSAAPRAREPQSYQAVWTVGIGFFFVGIGVGLLVAHHFYPNPVLFTFGCVATCAGIGMAAGGGIAYGFFRKQESSQQAAAERPGVRA